MSIWTCLNIVAAYFCILNISKGDYLISGICLALNVYFIGRDLGIL